MKNKGADASGDKSVVTKESTHSASTSVEGYGSNVSFVVWPPARWLNGSAGERACYFNSLQKEVACLGGVPRGHQAATLLDLMTIRAFHSKMLRCYSLGTAIGFRIRGGVQTTIPAIIAFVARKVHRHWLHEGQELPVVLGGPGGVWCDVDVVEFSYFGSPAQAPKESTYMELVEGLQGHDPTIGPGSQVACYESYGTLGAIVRSRTGLGQVGFLTNRHVAVDLDHPVQKMFHPLPPHLGPGVYLGAVERTTTFVRDDLWYGVFASMNPESFVRADGAFIPFDNAFDIRNVTPLLKGVGDVGEVMHVDLQAPPGNLIGRRVMKVGRSSGLTKGIIMAYAVEYNNDKGHCFFNDFLIVSEDKQTFELEGDSGSLILVTGDEGSAEKPRPIGIVWGGTTHRGRLKLHNWKEPENWTSGVDLGRLLESLQLDVVSTKQGLCEAVKIQRGCMTSSLDSLPPRSSLCHALKPSPTSRHLPQPEEAIPDLDRQDSLDDGSSSEAAKELLSTATFEASAAHLQPSDLPTRKSECPMSFNLHTGLQHTENQIFKINDPFELSLSSPLSGGEHHTYARVEDLRLIEGATRVEEGMGCNENRLHEAPMAHDPHERGAKKTRHWIESRFLVPNS